MMATHSLTTSRVQGFVGLLTEWAEVPSDSKVDIPFIIAGCAKRSVIFDLCFWMELLDGDPELLTDLVIGGCFGRRGSKPSRFEGWTGGPEEAPLGETKALDEDDELSSFT